MNYISKNDYEKLHEYKLQPLSIKIDVDNFLSEIIKFDEYFRPWGDKYNDLPRYGLPLINENGKLNNEIEPACWPLDRYNFIVKQKYEDTPENFIEFYNNVKNNNIDNLITEALSEEEAQYFKELEEQSLDKQVFGIYCMVSGRK